MREAPVHLFPAGPLIALVGNPNSGKTALFNSLTGSRQKVANYAGVTVEHKEGRMRTASGQDLRVIDLPGTYSLHPRSQDERVTCDALAGRMTGLRRPDALVCVLDATNLRRGLRLVLALKRQGLPCVVALNMVDKAARRGMPVDREALAGELGLPVVATVAVRAGGDLPLRQWLDAQPWRRAGASPSAVSGPPAAATARVPTASAGGGTADGIDDASRQLRADQQEVRRMLTRLGLDEVRPDPFSERVDRVLLHPAAGPLVLALVLFLVFQAVFSGAAAPMEAIRQATDWAGHQVNLHLPEGLWRSLIADGLIAGAGGVVVFLPQILILFFFILVLEESGYLPRAAFLLDRLMGSVGLSGRSFIPLLSSFACAVPGVMATRTIPDRRDRAVTILLAPLMTCSARLPVYALLIGAFIPARRWAGLDLRGLVLFGLYIAGIGGAMLVAWLAKRLTGAGALPRPLMLELPDYHLPTPRNIAIGLWQRARIFLRRVGGVILMLTVALWLLSNFPVPPAGSTVSPIEYSLAGRLGHALAPLFEPLGFNWQISVALVPALAAREVLVSALGTVYAVAASAGDVSQALALQLASQWSLATALSLLTWFVFAPQCLSTLAVIRRETGGWRLPMIAAGYLFTLAWLSAFAVYRVCVGFGLG